MSIGKTQIHTYPKHKAENKSKKSFRNKTSNGEEAALIWALDVEEE